MHPALVTVNCAYNDECLMTEEKLKEIIKSGKFPESYPEWEQVEVFFSEVPAETVWEFCLEYGISREELKAYYEKNIKPHFINEEIEELWKY